MKSRIFTIFACLIACVGAYWAVQRFLPHAVPPSSPMQTSSFVSPASRFAPGAGAVKEANGAGALGASFRVKLTEEAKHSPNAQVRSLTQTLLDEEAHYQELASSYDETSHAYVQRLREGAAPSELGSYQMQLDRSIQELAESGQSIYTTTAKLTREYVDTKLAHLGKI